MLRFYYDTVVHDKGVLGRLIEYVGADHVLLGSDYPFDMGSYRGADEVRELTLSADTERAILGGNAEQLLGLSTRREQPV